MIAFEVTINDETKIVAGIEDISVLSFILSYRKASGEEDDLVDEIDLSVGGLCRHGRYDSEHLDWVKRHMTIGDKIAINIVDIAESSQPLERRRDDPNLVEKAERKYYESLKNEYEGD